MQCVISKSEEISLASKSQYMSQPLVWGRIDERKMTNADQQSKATYDLCNNSTFSAGWWWSPRFLWAPRFTGMIRIIFTGNYKPLVLNSFHLSENVRTYFSSWGAMKPFQWPCITPTGKLCHAHTVGNIFEKCFLWRTRRILDMLYSAQHGNQHKDAFAWIIYHDPCC